MPPSHSPQTHWSTSLYPLGLWWWWQHCWTLNCRKGHSSVFLKDNTCSQPESPTDSSCKISEAQQHAFILSHLCPLQSKLAAFLLKQLIGSMCHTCNHFRAKWLSNHMLGVFSRPSILIFGTMGSLNISKSSSSDYVWPNNSFFSVCLPHHLLLQAVRRNQATLVILFSGISSTKYPS